MFTLCHLQMNTPWGFIYIFLYDTAWGYCLSSVLEDPTPQNFIQIFVITWSKIIFGISHILLCGFLFLLLLFWQSTSLQQLSTFQQSSNKLRASACSANSSGVWPGQVKDRKAGGEAKRWRHREVVTEKVGNNDLWSIHF